MSKKRAAPHNARTNKKGEVFTPKHNDRNYDYANDDHISSEKTHENIYWKIYDDAETFEENEKQFYTDHFSEWREKVNENYKSNFHPEKCKTLDEYRKSKLGCPEETLFYLGGKDDHADGQTLLKAFEKYLEWEKKNYPQIVTLDYALHLDEATPHIHQRKVYLYQDQDGYEKVGQAKSLEQMGVKLFNEDEPSGRHNNRKMTYTEASKSQFRAIAQELGIEVEFKAREASKSGKTLLEYQNEHEEEINEQLDTEIEQKTAILGDLSRKTKKEKSQLDEIETELDKLNIEYFEAKSKLANTEQEYIAKENKIAELEVKMSELSEQIAEKENIWDKMEEIDYQVAEYENVKRELAKKDMFGKEKDYVKLSRNQAAALYMVGKRQEKWDEEVAQKEKHFERLEDNANAIFSKLEKDKKSIKRDKNQLDDLIKYRAYSMNQKFEAVCQKYGYKAVCKAIDALLEPIRPERNQDEYYR